MLSRPRGVRCQFGARSSATIAFVSAGTSPVGQALRRKLDDGAKVPTTAKESLGAWDCNDRMEDFHHKGKLDVRDFGLAWWRVVGYGQLFANVDHHLVLTGNKLLVGNRVPCRPDLNPSPPYYPVIFQIQSLLLRFLYYQ